MVVILCSSPIAFHSAPVLMSSCEYITSLLSLAQPSTLIIEVVTWDPLGGEVIALVGGSLSELAEVYTDMHWVP